MEAVGGEVRTFLHQFLQVEAQDFPKFLVNLTVLALAYRVVAMCILLVRVREEGGWEEWEVGGEGWEETIKICTPHLI